MVPSDIFVTWDCALAGCLHTRLVATVHRSLCACRTARAGRPRGIRARPHAQRQLHVALRRRRQCGYYRCGAAVIPSLPVDIMRSHSCLGTSSFSAFAILFRVPAQYFVMTGSLLVAGTYWAEVHVNNISIANSPLPTAFTVTPGLLYQGTEEG